jgi:hypothetical protein
MRISHVRDIKTDWYQSGTERRKNCFLTGVVLEHTPVTLAQTNQSCYTLQLQVTNHIVRLAFCFAQATMDLI